MTVHFVTAELDGGPIILQRTVPVLDDDTRDALAARILAEEHRAYPEAVQDRAGRAAGGSKGDGSSGLLTPLQCDDRHFRRALIRTGT